MKRPECLVEDEHVELQLHRRLMSHVVEQLRAEQYLRWSAHGQRPLCFVKRKKNTLS